MKKKHKYALRRALLVAIPLIILAIVLICVNSCKREDYRVLQAEEIALYTQGNEYSSREQEDFVEAALSLVGKVRYFWGGKSSAVGWDDEWGTMKTVTSSGSSTTGTERPYGLDCSGYVSWCFIQTGATPQQMSQSIGEGTWNQWQKSGEIDKIEARLGDIAFINRYPGATGNHIGIVVGFDAEGEPLIAHCTSSYDDVVVSTCGDQFRYFRRPAFLEDNRQ